MFELILTQLAAKNPGVSRKVLELIAKGLAKKITQEDQIEGAIADYEANSPLSIKEFADFIQQQGDVRVTEARKKWESEKKPSNPTNNEKDVKTESDEMPEWAKSIFDKVTSLEGVLSQKAKESMLEKFVVKAKEKGIPEAFARRTVISDDFNIDEALASLETEWSEIKQLTINQNIQSNGGKGITGAMGNEGKTVIDAIKVFAQNNVQKGNSISNGNN